MTPPPAFAAPRADSSVSPPADPLDRVGVERVAAFLSRLEAGRRELEQAGASLSAAGRAADAAAMEAAADRYEAATAAMRSLAADRATLLAESGAESISALVSRNRALVSRVGSLRESVRETRAALWPRWVAARRSAAACGEVLDLIARGGVRSATYGANAGCGDVAAGGALLNLSG